MLRALAIGIRTTCLWDAGVYTVSLLTNLIVGAIKRAGALRTAFD